VYGILGTSSPANIPGGRSDALSWTDPNGNFWLFGGNIYTVYLNGWGGYENDLWMYSPQTNEWTWMGGSSSLPSTCTLSNSCGQPGLYGQQQTASAANIPGAREDSITWTDQAGNLWLFGGFGFDVQDVRGDLNDLWEFSPSTKEWKWVAGSDSVGFTYSGPAGTYGLWQISAAGNSPGGREQGVGWTDSAGNLWLFGGYGFGSSNGNGAFSAGRLNDLWEFNPATSQWTWISGSSSVNQNGSYGTMGQSSVAATPGSRIVAASWTDKSGDLWLYGGYGDDSSGNFDNLGDLWVFKPNAAGLPVVAAPSIAPAGGTYAAVQSVTITDSTPGATIYYRIGSAGAPVLYDGPINVYSSETVEAVASASGYADSTAASATYVLNLPPPPAPSFNPPPGTYYGGQSVSISEAEPYATIYYTTDGTTPTSNSPVYSGAVPMQATGTLNAIAVVSGGASTLTSGTYTILPVPPNTWTFVRGDPTNPNDAGVYGLLGTALAPNQPGGRVGSASWMDGSGNLWIFGGYGADTYGNLGYLNDLWEYQPGPQIQDGEWVWMGGSTTGNQDGIGGAQGQPGVANVPGARQSAQSWVDSNGNFWLFGGLGVVGSNFVTPLSDLWKFDILLHQWTWVGGSITSNQAGVYGTLGTPASGSMPGSRYGAVGWKDSSGNFWLFGGYGNADNSQIDWLLNDLWKFNPSTNQWAWMGGNNTLNCTVLLDGTPDCVPDAGVYGQMGTPNSANIPGSRFGAVGWTDSHGKFWLFGGAGYDSTGTGGNPNDLWMYDSSTNQWTWESGSTMVPCGFNLQVSEDLCTNPPAVLGTLGVPAPSNTPPGSTGAATWVDQQGNLWLFGSNTSIDVTGTYQGRSSDLWMYSPSINQWAWMGGDFATSNCAWIILSGYPGVTQYVCQGSQGVNGGQYQSAIGIEPASRSGATAWTDKQGNVWLFGGEISVPLNVARASVQNPFTAMNDLWTFQPSAATLPAAATPILSLTGGSYLSGGPLVISNGMATAKIYYTTDGTYPTAGSNLYTGPINLSSSETVSAIAMAPGYINSGVASASYLFPPQPATPVFSLPSGTYDTVQTVSLSESALYASIEYTTDGSAPGSATTQSYTEPIVVSSSETINAVGFVSGDIVTRGIANIDLNHLTSSVASATYTLNLPTTATPTFSVPAGTYTSPQTVSIGDSTTGAIIYYTLDGTTPTTKSPLYAGPISVSTTETIQAIATGKGYAQSAVATATYTINLAPPSFAITGTAVTVTRGATSGNTSTITLTPSGGFTGTVNLTCAIAPTAASDPATCSIPQSVAISGASAQTVTLTVTTTAATAALNHTRKLFWPSVGGTALACILLVGIPSRRRRWQSMLGLLVLLISITGTVTACGGGNAGGGGGGGNQGTTPGAYTITVTGTSGALSASGTVSLTVQ
jgi:N-acetylneuraminic acid mutarotase